MSAPDGMTISLTMYLSKSAKLCSSPQGPTTFGPRRSCTAAQILRSAYIRNARLTSTTTITARHCARISTKSPKPVSKKPSIPPLLRRHRLPRPLAREPRQLRHHLARPHDRVGEVVLGAPPTRSPAPGHIAARAPASTRSPAPRRSARDAAPPPPSPRAAPPACRTAAACRAAADSARRIAQFSRASPGGNPARFAICGRPSVLTKMPRLLGPGRARQDHVGPVRPAVAVAALVDHERPRRHLDLVRPEVVDHLRPSSAAAMPPSVDAAEVHRPDPARRRVQHQQLRAGRLAERHRRGRAPPRRRRGPAPPARRSPATARLAPRLPSRLVARARASASPAGAEMLVADR